MPPSPPSSQENNPTPRHELLVSPHMQYTVLKPKETAKGKKAASTKKVENKNKEFTFVFDPSKENYVAFLSALLEKHGHIKYTPVTLPRRFSIKVLVPPKKAYVLCLHPSYFIYSYPFAFATGRKMLLTLIDMTSSRHLLNF